MKNQFKFVYNYLYNLHIKTSSWVAGMIGPMVFNIGTNDKNWNLTVEQLLQYPKGSLGKALGSFLKEQNVELLKGAEYHDVHHVLFDFSISFKDEVALQFFLHGNGKKSIASISTRIGAWLLLPFEWKYLNNAYERGKRCKDITKLNYKALLYDDLSSIKASLFHS
jgi:ubiquinone biosynthesis protein Coq4